MLLLFHSAREDIPVEIIKGSPEEISGEHLNHRENFQRNLEANSERISENSSVINP